MVKNKLGGNKAKRTGRKFVGAPGASTQLRLAEEEDELYAAASKMLGNGMFEATCSDGQVRICYMPKKFRGRGKRDNTVTLGGWTLVGRRSWEVSTPAAGARQEKCDLLEVYTSQETDRLKKLDLNWSALLKVADIYGNGGTEDIGDILFTDEKTAEYSQLAAGVTIDDASKTLCEAKQWDSAPALMQHQTNKKISTDDDEIDIDDI